jgi:hypothetical protein
VTGERAVRVRLDFEEPFARQDIGVGRSWNKAPGTVVDETLVLSHGRTPIRVSQPTAIVGRNGLMSPLYCTRGMVPDYVRVTGRDGAGSAAGVGADVDTADG